MRKFGIRWSLGPNVHGWAIYLWRKGNPLIAYARSGDSVAWNFGKRWQIGRRPYDPVTLFHEIRARRRAGEFAEKPGGAPVKVTSPIPIDREGEDDGKEVE